MNEHRVAGGPLYQGANGRTIQSNIEVAFPMPRDLSVVDVLGPFGQHGFFGDMGP